MRRRGLVSMFIFRNVDVKRLFRESVAAFCWISFAAISGALAVFFLYGLRVFQRFKFYGIPGELKFQTTVIACNADEQVPADEHIQLHHHKVWVVVSGVVWVVGWGRGSLQMG
jgi:hypothetical protein